MSSNYVRTSVWCWANLPSGVKMFKRLAAALLFFTVSVLTVAQQQSVTVGTSSFQPGWVNVPAPGQPEDVEIYPGLSSGFPYNFPTDLPTGDIQIAYTLVDQYDRHTAMSPITTISPTQGNWRLVINPVGLSKDTPACAVCWWWNDSGTWRILGGPLFSENPVNAVRPYFPITGWYSNVVRGFEPQLTMFSAWNTSKYWWPVWTDPSWKKLSLIPAPTLAPSVRLYDKPLPLDQIDVAYTWACNISESQLSPAVTYPAAPAGNNRRYFIEVARSAIPPQGACGMYVYLRKNSGQWHRQPAPHVVSAVDANDWCWRLDSNIIHIDQFVETGIEPSITPGKSYLSSLHKAIQNSTASVIVNTDQVISCPIIMPLTNGQGMSTVRTVSAMAGSSWKLSTPLISPGGPTAWPMWVENSQYTRLVGCQMSSPKACAGVAFVDHSGSGAFHFRSERLNISLTYPDATGIVALESCRAKQGHSASEPIFTDTVIYSTFPVVIEYKQSANWTFEYLTATADGTPQSAIITQGNTGFVNLRGRLTCDNARAIVAATVANEVNLENVFTDTGIPEWVVVSYYNSPKINVSVRGMNVRTPFIHLVTATSPSKTPIIAKFTGTASEPCDDVCNFTTRYNGLQFQGDPSYVVQHLIARQPTLAEWQQTRYWNEWDAGVVTPNQPVVIVKP